MCAKTTIGVLLFRAGDVLFEPFELFVAKSAEAAGLEVQDIHESDKMGSLVIEAVPAIALVPWPKRS